MSHFDASGGETGDSPVSSCIAQLSSRDPRQVAAGARQIATLGPAAEPGLGLLIDALWHPHPGVVNAAANALSDIGISRPDVLDALVATLRRGDPAVYPAAIDALLRLDRGHKAFIHALLALLNHSNPAVVADMLTALAQSGDRSQHVINSIALCVRHPAEHVITSACRALSAAGSGARTAVPTLLSCLETCNPFIGATVVRALARIGVDDADQAADLLIRLVNRAHVGSTSAMPKFSDAAQPSGAPVTMEGALLVFEIAKWPAVALRVLTEALHHEDPRIAVAAAWSLGKMGKRAHDATEALKQASQHFNPDVARQATLALASIQAACGSAATTG